WIAKSSLCPELARCDTLAALHRPYLERRFGILCRRYRATRGRDGEQVTSAVEGHRTNQIRVLYAQKHPRTGDVIYDDICACAVEGYGNATAVWRNRERFSAGVVHCANAYRRQVALIADPKFGSCT